MSFAGPRTSAGARMLPRPFYLSAEIFEREIETLFLDDWLYAGHESQLRRPGDSIVVSQAGESAILVRGGDGRIRALANVCRHRGARLCRSDGALPGAIQCPYHAWTYELDGTLRSAPSMNEVDGFEADEHALAPLGAAVSSGLVFVSFSTTPPRFETRLAPPLGRLAAWPLAELRSVHRTVYEVEANWKLLFQNYSECYHCPNVHPVLNRLTPFRDSTNDLSEGRVLGGPMRLAEPHRSMTMTGEAAADPLPGLGDEACRRVYYYTIFPNLFLSLHPDYVLVHRSRPLAADRTRIQCDWLFHPEAIDAPGFDPSGAIEFWDMTNRQDWELCTLSQQGIGSRHFEPGPYAELESQLAAFDREYLRLLGVTAEEIGDRYR